MLEYSDRDFATFAAIARAKGPSSVAPLADALIENNNLQPLNQGTTAPDIPLVDHGCCTAESDHVVGQYPWLHYPMHSQMDPQESGLTLENWPLGTNNVSNQIPAPFQTDRHPPAEHAIWKVPVSYNPPVSYVKPSIGFSDSFSSFPVKSQMFSILQNITD
jgi:hypothetical protein